MSNCGDQDAALLLANKGEKIVMDFRDWGSAVSRMARIAVVACGLSAATQGAAQQAEPLPPTLGADDVRPPPGRIVAAPMVPDLAKPGAPKIPPVPAISLALPPSIQVVSPPARSPNLPRTRWQHRRGNAMWTRTALSALKSHGKPLVDIVPADIADWCPAYPTANEADRRAFWVGFLSALAKHESTYKARAVGGGGLWYGLLQILPATARGYKCNAGTGEDLQNGSANLSCAVRIMAKTVPRDGVIYGQGGRGVAADWGPMRSPAKRMDMSRWLKRQSYCKPLDATRPKARP